MSRLTFPARVVNGKLELDRGAFARAVASLPDGEVIIKIQDTRRSDAQNRTYWLWLHLLSEHTGYTPEELHQICKEQFNGRTHSDVHPETGEIEDRHGYQSTATLDVQQFSIYLDRVRQWAAEVLGVNLPDPALAEPGPPR